MERRETVNMKMESRKLFLLGYWHPQHCPFNDDFWCPGGLDPVPAEAAEYSRHPTIRQPGRGVQGRLFYCVAGSREDFPASYSLRIRSFSTKFGRSLTTNLHNSTQNPFITSWGLGTNISEELFIDRNFFKARLVSWLRNFHLYGRQFDRRLVATWI
jgi:hypothetical protein